MRRVKILGPGSFDAWKACFMLLMVCLMGFNQVDQYWCMQYLAKIERYHVLYGAVCWALLYQVDVRCRFIRMPKLRQLMWIDHKNKLKASQTSTYNVGRPWNDMWRKSIKDDDWF